MNDFNIKGGVYEVKIQNEAEGRRAISDISDTVIPTKDGDGVPLSAISTIEYTVGPRETTSYNKMLSASLDVLPADGVASSEVMRLIESVKLPKGYRVEWGRIAAQEKENEGQLVKLLVLLCGELWATRTLPLPKGGRFGRVERGGWYQGRNRENPFRFCSPQKFRF